MIQKIVNAFAILAFLGVAGIGGAGYYVFSNKDDIIKNLLPIPGIPDDLAVPEIPSPGPVGGGSALPSVPTPSF